MSWLVESPFSVAADVRRPGLLFAPEEGKPLFEKGVREKDEIASINGKPVFQVMEADQLLKECADKDAVLQVRRRGPTFENEPGPRTIRQRAPSTSSSGRSALRLGPTRNSAQGRVRLPAALGKQGWRLAQRRVFVDSSRAYYIVRRADLSPD